jgi:hypothetical protein
MVRRLLVLALVFAVATSASCVLPTYGAVFAPVMDTKSTLAVGDTTVGMSNVGEAMAEGIILLARGDASLTTAMRNGSQGPITRIHHVDTEELNILSIYCKQVVRVYGE